MLSKLIAFTVFALAACAHSPFRIARIVDGTDNEKTVWVCVPEAQDPRNEGGLMCARMDHVMVQPHDSEPADAGAATM